LNLSYQQYSPIKAENKCLFVLHGSEIPLRNEIKDALKLKINEKKDYKINVVHHDEFENLATIIQSISGGSLFGDKMLLIIQHLEGRFPETLNTFLNSLTEQSFNNAKIIVETSSPLPKNKPWNSNSYLLTINCEKLNTFEEKIRLKKKLSFLSDELLSAFGKEIFINHEGNLLASDNAVKILEFLSTNQEENSFSTHFSSTMDIFALEDLVLAQDFEKLSLHLAKLKKEQPEEIIPITWIANRIFLVGLIMKSNPKFSNQELKQLKIWSNKLALYKNLFSNIELKKIYAMLDKTHLTDKANKGASHQKNWNLIEGVFAELKSCL